MKIQKSAGIIRKRQKQEHVIRVDGTKCVGCGSCAMECPLQNIRIEAQRAVITTNDCIQCGHCVAVCPKHAISISGYRRQPEEMPKRSPVPDPEEFLTYMKFRRTIRRFRKEEIPKEVLGRVLEAGNLTHTCRNSRDTAFVILKEKLPAAQEAAVKEARKAQRFAGAKERKILIDSQFFFRNAPLAIVIFADHVEDGLLAAENMAIEAEANGLGVLISGSFTRAVRSSGAVRKAMDVRTGKICAATLVLGYPAVRFQRSVPRDNPKVLYR